MPLQLKENYSKGNSGIRGSINRGMVVNSREDGQGRQLTSWSLSKGKPEPSIEDYIINIDGSMKHQQNLVKNSSISASRVQPKSRLKSHGKTSSRSGLRNQLVNVA